MATNPCGTDTSLEDIKAAQEELNSIVSGGANALAAINSKVSEIGDKLNSFKPEVKEDPNLQKEMAKLQGADPITAGGIIQGIKQTFGPLVDNINELIDEVSPGLSEASDKVSNNPFDLSALTELASLSPSSADVCSKVKNIEVKTLPDGTQTTVEKPAPPAVPQTVPLVEPYKEPQTLATKNNFSAALLAFQSAQNWARDKLLNEMEQRGFPPQISELEHKKNGNRMFSYYTFIYIKYAEIVGLDPDPTLWPRRITPWVEVKYAGKPEYIGDDPFDENYIYNEEYAYFQAANNTTFTYEEVVQRLYDDTPAEAAKVFVGTTANKYFKEI